MLKNKKNLTFVKTKSSICKKTNKIFSFSPLPLLANRSIKNKNSLNTTDRVEYKIENFEFKNESQTRDVMNSMNENKETINLHKKNISNTKMSIYNNSTHLEKTSINKIKSQLSCSTPRQLLNVLLTETNPPAKTIETNLGTNKLIHSMSYAPQQKNYKLSNFKRTSLLFGSNAEYYESVKFLSNPIIKEKIKDFSKMILATPKKICEKHILHKKKLVVDFPDAQTVYRARKIIDDPKSHTLLVFKDPNNMENWNLK